MRVTRIEVPDIGDYKNIPVIEVLVEVGQRVEQEQSLVMLESDKATMDVPSPTAGVIKELKVAVGDKVSQGALIVLIESERERHDEAVPVPAAAAVRDLTRPEANATTVPAYELKSAPAPMHRAPSRECEPHCESHASPAVRKLARELGVEISRVQSTGPKQRVTLEDVTAFVRNAMTTSTGTPTVSTPPVSANGAELGLLPWPKVDFAKFGPVDSQPLSRIKKISGANLHRNWVMIPHVTNNDEADITELEALRTQLNKEYEKAGVKFTMLAFVIKAVVVALKKFPTLNASLQADNLMFKQYYHIGFAADTPNGLVVPVIRDADKKGLVDIAKEMGELSKLARESKLKPDQMQGGCFSISSLGGIGGTHFTPIINAPEVAILGLSKSAMKPVWDGQQFMPRLILPLSLSFDHRALDGAEAGRFNAYLVSLLADYRRMLL
ncbi:pyruvate dehydrogenase E2 component (dihydrolipoamide acetyltransferase) [Paraburkholderia unamae]|uniref:Acetyltransferase component of pyruvate dehydrogenase complex n=1 Tax=Paraburkholderia unamae TaxID=219649 RepID=A0ABX5KCJ3_9BURK|nr:pyruvate dehydrogenase E2 component (dihydrolipoamide acetyltransferase) [Paraburkholderia unamae]